MARRVDRSTVLAYRVAAHGLDRRGGRLAVLDLGVQDTPPGSARLAVAARTPAGAAAVGGPLATAWTMRGAPHLHPAAELPRLAAALWPLSETDALARVSWQRARLAEVGMAALDALTTVVDAVREVVTSPMTKGAASGAVSAVLAPALVPWCRACGVHHVFESVFRLAALPAGIALEPDTSPVRLTPIDDWAGRPDRAEGVDDLIRTYLRLLGPAGPADVAGFLASTRGELRRHWPDGLVEVEVDGRSAWLPETELDALTGAAPPRLVRLLPPSDPFLQARDRDLVLPDRAAQRTLWTALGQPGALLVDGEIAGVWRPRSSGRTLRITVTLFGELAADDRAAVDEEAQRVAAVRGAGRVEVRYG